MSKTRTWSAGLVVIASVQYTSLKTGRVVDVLSGSSRADSRTTGRKYVGNNDVCVDFGETRDALLGVNNDRKTESR